MKHVYKDLKEEVQSFFEVISFHRTACLIKCSRGNGETVNLNSKLGYNRSLIPDLGNDDSTTPKEIEENDNVIEEILNWNEDRKKEKAEEKKKKVVGKGNENGSCRKENRRQN